MLSFLSGFINRNRTKLIIATVALTTIGTVYYIYNNTSNQIQEDHIDQDCDQDKYKNDRYQQHSIQLLSSSHQSKLCNRSRIIWKIRKQYDSAINKLLITFKLKIIELIDIQSTVRNIKELRSKYKNTNTSSSNLKTYEELEDQLWNEIKISTFTILFVISYVLPAICILLKIQLYILARSLLLQLNDTDDISQVSLLDTDMFRLFVEGTFQHIYGNGLISFISNVKQSVAKHHLLPWIVKQKVQVQPGELAETMQLIRNDIESEHNIIQTIFLPAADLDGSAVDTKSLSPVQSLLNQTWDIFESPEFNDVYKESVDTTYRIISAEIQLHIFSIPPMDYYSHIMSGSHTTTPIHTTTTTTSSSIHNNNSYSNNNNTSNNSSKTLSIDAPHINNSKDYSQWHSNPQLITTPPSRKTPPSTIIQSEGTSTPHSQYTQQQQCYSSMKAPPLASVLPQLKSIALKLLPTNTSNIVSNPTTTTTSSSANNSNIMSSTNTTCNNNSSIDANSTTNHSTNNTIQTTSTTTLTNNNDIITNHTWINNSADSASSITLISNEIKEISSGPYLESFCIAILDADINN